MGENKKTEKGEERKKEERKVSINNGPKFVGTISRSAGSESHVSDLLKIINLPRTFLTLLKYISRLLNMKVTTKHGFLDFCFLFARHVLDDKGCKQGAQFLRFMFCLFRVFNV